MATTVTTATATPAAAPGTRSIWTIDPAHTGEVMLSPDLVRASFEAAILSPLGPLDAQTLLELDDAVDRLDSLSVLLFEEIELLEFRLSG